MTDETERTGPVHWVRDHLSVSIGIGVVIVGIAAGLAFGFFGIQSAFIDDKVDEAGPAFDSGAGSSADGTVPNSELPDDVEMDEDAPAVETLAVGDFVDRSHPSTGEASVLTDGAQSFLRFEDFETDNGPDLFVYLSAGVDVDSPADAFDDDFIDLGRLRGNIGDQNYELPDGVDLEDFSTVVIWCKRFGVAFGAAELSAL